MDKLNIMKLSIKELQMLSKGLKQVTCTGDHLYKKINRRIDNKRRKELERKEKEKQIKAVELADKAIKEAFKMFDTHSEISKSLKSFYSSLGSYKKEDTLQYLINNVGGIVSIHREDTYRGDITTLTVDLHSINEEDLLRVIRFKKSNEYVFIKFI